MKIAYLLQSDVPYHELVETINQLIKQGDHVFIMVNDNDLRDKIYFVYAESKRVHISHTQEFGQEGDLSLARGTLIQMKEAIALEEEFDYFINLSEGMIPIKRRDEIVSFLEKDNADYFYVKEDETQNPLLRQRFERYFALTNLLVFPKSKVAKTVAKATAKVSSIFGLKKKYDGIVKVGSPYFAITNKSGQVLCKNFDYVSEHFKLSWYAEEMYIPMMFDKFQIGPNINSDLRVIGESGVWQTGQGPKQLTQEIINQYPNALFAGKITSEENLQLYEEYFDVYNQ